MPATPAPEIIAAHQAGWTEVYTRVDIYEADTTTLWMGNADHIDGSVSVDSNRDERRTASLSLGNTSGKLRSQPGGFWYDKVIKIFRGIRYYDANLTTQTYEIQLGEFYIDDIDSENFPDVIQVSLRDATRKLLQAKFATSTEFASGVSIESVINAIAVNGGIPSSKISLPATGVNTGRAFLFDRTTERWKAIKDIATSYGYDVYFDNTGVLTMSAFTDPSNPAVSPSVFTFETGSRDIKNGGMEAAAEYAPRAYVWYVSNMAPTGSPLAAVLTSMGYAVTHTNTEPSLNDLVNGGYDVLVCDASFWAVTSTLLATAYNAYVAGINVYTTGNDTQAVAGNPIWTGQTTVSAAQLQPNAPSGYVGASAINYLSNNWSNWNDTDNTKYLTGIRGGAVTIMNATYTVDSTLKPVGIAEIGGGTTIYGRPSRYVHVQAAQNGTTAAMWDFQRRVLNWISDAVPSWWEADFEIGAGGGAGVYMIERDNPHSGSAALKIIQPAVSSSQATAFMSKAIPVNPGDVYKASMWSRAQTAAGGQVNSGPKYFRIQYGTTETFTNGQRTAIYDIIAGGTYSIEWSKDEGTFSVPAGVSWMRVGAYAWTNAGQEYTAWFDDFQVTRLEPSPDTKGNLVHYKRKVSSARIYNHVVVSGESTSTAPVYNQVENNTATSPTRIGKLGRRTYFYTSSFITTTGQALTVATNFLKRVALEQFEVGVDSIVLPWLEPGSIVTLDDPDSVASDPVRYLLADLTIPIRPAAMQANLRRVTIVG